MKKNRLTKNENESASHCSLAHIKENIQKEKEILESNVFPHERETGKNDFISAVLLFFLT